MTLPIYLDHAATTPVLPEVLTAMLPYFSEYYGNASSRYHAYGWLAEEAFTEANNTIAHALNCSASHIIHTSGATESVNLALKSNYLNHPQSKIIAWNSDHKAALSTLQNLNEIGANTCILDVDKNGMPDILALEETLAQGPALISVLYVNNETGLIFPLDEILALKQKYEFKIHVDATQAIGKIPIDFNNSAIDFLSFSAHKIYGPKGAGCLVSKDKIAAIIHGGGQQQSQRSGTLNMPAIMGMAKALEIATVKINEYNSHTSKLKSQFEAQLKSGYPAGFINTESENRVSNISNFCFVGKDPEKLLHKLNNMAISNGSACNSAHTTPSHVLTAMHLSTEDAFASLRFSFGWQNTADQIDEVMAKIIQATA